MGKSYLIIIYYVPCILVGALELGHNLLGDVSVWLHGIFSPVSWGIVLCGPLFLELVRIANRDDYLPKLGYVATCFIGCEVVIGSIATLFSDASFAEVFSRKFFAASSFAAYLITFSLPFAIYWVIKTKDVFINDYWQKPSLKAVIFGVALLLYAMFMTLIAINHVIDWRGGSYEVLPGVTSEQFHVYKLARAIGQAAIAYLLFFKFFRNIYEAKTWVITTFAAVVVMGGICVYPLGIWTVKDIMLNIWWTVLTFLFTCLISVAGAKSIHVKKDATNK